VEIKRKDFLNHKLHSLWELDSWEVQKYVQITDFYVIKKVSMWL
jgi:hypothetical protein